MIGGYDDSNNKMTTVYEFKHDGSNYVWELKPYSLGTARSSSVPLYVPDEFVNCT